MKPKKGFIRLSLIGILSILSWIMLVALLIALLAAHVNPGNYQFIAVFGLLFPVFFLTNLILVFIWFAIWHRMLIPHLIFLALSLPLAFSYFAFNRNTERSGDLTAITYNVHGFRGHQTLSDTVTTKQQIERLLASKQFDVVCIQEFLTYTQEPQDELVSFVHQSGYTYYHYEQYWVESGNKLEGLLILSNFPIKETGNLSISGQRTFSAWVDIATTSSTIIRVYNIHMASNRLRRSEVDFIGDGQFIDREKVREVGKTVFGKFIQSFSMRASELMLLQNHLKGNAVPTLLCGDFNDTPSSFTYKQLNKLGFSDGFLKSGHGFGSTYAGNIPFQRIDYLFSSNGLSSTYAQVFKLPHSNHYPLVGTFQLKTIN
jgi:endonuclease/exonuclease/phosphatase family metal-dependent hydrolase